MVKTKIVEWQHFFLVLDRFYHNRSVSSPRQQLSKPTRVQKMWKFTPMMEGMRKISLVSRTITHAALPSCRVFLGVEHEIFNQTKVETFVQSVGLILVSDWASVSSSWVERREITTGTYRRREHRTCRAQRPPRWRAWRWRTCPGSPCWKGKICYSQIQQLTWDSNWENGCWKKEGKSGFRFVGCGLGRSQCAVYVVHLAPSQ